MFRGLFVGLIAVSDIVALTLKSVALKFERVTLLDNYTCIAEDRNFIDEARSIPECTATCMLHGGCSSVYFRTSTGTCYGCNSAYYSSIGLQQEPGTKYLRPRKPCGAGWIAFKNSCYVFGEKTVNLQTAVSWCGSENAQLVFVDDEEENIFLKSNMATVSGTEDRHYFIGIQYESSSGTWQKYQTTKSVTFQDWYDNGTFSESKSCAIFSWQLSFQWDKVPCTQMFCALCELTL